MFANNIVFDYVFEISGTCLGSFSFIFLFDEIFYFLIRKFKIMFIDFVDFGMIWKERKSLKWLERCVCFCSKFDRLFFLGLKLSILCFE